LGLSFPDSDYDVRFVYVRSRDWYLQLRPGRDVIERPIEGEIDLSGWDIRKALGLLLKSNAVISEWIDSPIRYRADEPLVTELRGLADQVLDARALGHHYTRLGGNAAERWLDGSDPVPVKRYFYALRPALAIRALRHDPTGRPPMNLQALMAASHLPEELDADVRTLVDAKRQTNELSVGMRMPRLDALIRTELNGVTDLPARSRSDDVLLEHANEIFLELVNT
jgi:predicted nucleotidyltransferase